MFDSTSPLPPGPLPNSEFRIRNSEERGRGWGDGVRSPIATLPQVLEPAGGFIPLPRRGSQTPAERHRPPPSVTDPRRARGPHPYPLAPFPSPRRRGEGGWGIG